MLIPLGTDRPSKRIAIVNPVLIGINIGVFVMMAILAKYEPELGAKIGFYGAISRDHFHIWQPITSAFIHAGFMHIFGNMLFLLAFGPSVEDRFGRIGYLLFYLAGGAASGFAHIAIDAHPAVGASGAIAAVSGAFLVLFPNTRIRCFVIFFFIGIFMIPSWWLIGLFIILDLGAQVFTPANGIANVAHLGGYAFGIAIALGLLITKILPREQYDMFSILKHKKRRADFRAAHNHFAKAPVHVQNNRQARVNPISAEIAQARARVGELVSAGDLDDAADRYLEMLSEFSTESKALTMHRQAQYQIANNLYQRGLRQEASDAYSRLLDAYPNDPERQIITILNARVRAHDLNDPIGAITLLEELESKAIDPDTRSLIETELNTIRSLAGDGP